MSPRWEASTVHCPRCGPRPYGVWTTLDRWRVVACKGCGLRITWPRPDPAALEVLYSPGYYEERGMGPEASAAWLERAAEILARVPMAVRTALDFGAGQGHLVAAFRRLGLEVEGIEPAPAGRAASREAHGFELHADVSTLAPAEFDLVTLIHALEHVPDPVEALSTVTTLLRPGGFAFLEVPHAGSVEMWRPRRRREILDLPVHLYHFTPETLAQLIERAGLEVLRVHLSNPDALEWAFSLRAQWRSRRQPARARGEGPASAALRPREGEPNLSLWARRILPGIRRLFPGWKFQLIARRPAPPIGGWVAPDRPDRS